MLYRVMTGAIKGLDNARKVEEELRGMGYTELLVTTFGNAYAVEVISCCDKAKIDKARADVKKVTGKRAAVQTTNIY